MTRCWQRGTDVNAVSRNGHTPLLSAAIRFFEKKAPPLRVHGTTRLGRGGAYLLSRKLSVPRVTRNKIIHLLLATIPELEKELTTLRRRYWLNKLLNFILLLVVLRFLWLLLS